MKVNDTRWRDSDHVCALADAERHLGHALRAGERWLAFDATHMNGESNGFRFVGVFASAALAKEAIDASVADERELLAGAA